MKNIESPLSCNQWAYMRQEQHNDDRVSFVYNDDYTKYTRLRGKK